MSIRPDLAMYGKVLQYPPGYIAGQLELTSRCEQRCASCQSWIDDRTGAHSGELTLDDAWHVFTELGSLPHFEHLTLTGGDPMSWPYLHDLLVRYIEYRATVEEIKDSIPVTSSMFKLRINTALPFVIPDEHRRAWQTGPDELRVSLDAVSPEYYRQCRGVDRDPEEIFDWLYRLNHPRISTLTVVSDRNIDHISDIVLRLERFRKQYGPGFRKAIFIPVRPQNDQALIQITTGTHRTSEQEWQRKWNVLTMRYDWVDWMSWGEQVYPEEAHRIGTTCAVSRISFHIKYNGDLYPCCLIGGEALGTRTEYRIGNVFTKPIQELWETYQPLRNVYDNPDGVCARICLWKQVAMNNLAHDAKDVTLAMP